MSAWLLGWCVAWVSLALIAVCLARGIYTRLAFNYPFVYLQIASGLVVGCLTVWITIYHPPKYFGLYWHGETITMFIACGNLVEILRQVFAPNARAVRFAKVMYALICTTIGVFLTIYLARFSDWGVDGPQVVYERDFRAIQAMLLCALIGAIFYFGLPVGKNMTGVLIGYGIFIGSSLVTLALEARLLASVSASWEILHPVAYFIGVVVYLVSLWSYAPPPRPDTGFLGRLAGGNSMLRSSRQVPAAGTRNTWNSWRTRRASDGFPSDWPGTRPHG